MPIPTPEHVDQIVTAYEEGATLREIAEIYGVSHVTVRTLLKQAGVQLRKRGRCAVKREDPRVLPLHKLPPIEEVEERARTR